MMMGVPYLPFFLGAGSCLLLALYVNMFCLLAAPLVIAVMRQMARRDEMIFRLLGHRWATRRRVRNIRHHAGMWVFTANGRDGSRNT
jgi:type IV secretion system protein VirB3